MRRVPARSAIVRLAGIGAGAAIMAGLPATVAAHNLSTVYESPLPLAVYLAGAAATVALSFVFVLARDMRATPSPPGRILRIPLVVRVILRTLGLGGWIWIMAQGIAGGSSDAAVAPLFLWVYGWVGVAAISALLLPIWEWLDPFATLHDILAWILRTVGIRGWAVSELPDAIRLWPAVAGLAFFVWLELVAIVDIRTLTVVLAGYTLLTLAMMAQFGRDQWRACGETFTVWYRTLNRLAPYGVVTATERPDLEAQGEPTDASPEPDDAAIGLDQLDPDAIDASVVIRRPFASSLLQVSWEIPRIVLVAVGVGSILFDGLSQTVAFGMLFGAPPLGAKTLLLLAFLCLIAGAAFLVARAVSPGAIGAGLVPIAVGYLVAHYLTYLLGDGQKIVIAISDPLQTGADLFGTAFYVPSASWLPPGLVWTVQLASVVGGHMLGAWAGHVTAQRDMDLLARAKPPRDLRHRKIRGAMPALTRNVRQREIPLAVVMVALTTLTLWSLGQSIVQQPATQGSTPPAVASASASASP